MMISTIDLGAAASDNKKIIGYEEDVINHAASPLRILTRGAAEYRNVIVSDDVYAIQMCPDTSNSFMPGANLPDKQTGASLSVLKQESWD